MFRLISLTSIPPRFNSLGETLESLVAQNAADAIRLYVPSAYRRFPDWDGALPKVPSGVEIRRIDVDYGPATKVLCAVGELRGHNAQILFCDDDGTHVEGWADRLFAEQAKRPTMAVATWGRNVQGYLPTPAKFLRTPRVASIPLERDWRYRSERVLQKLFGYQPVKRPTYVEGFADVFFGVGGVVVRPEFFDDTAFDIPPVAWMVDDVWLSAMLAKNSVPIYCPLRLPMPIETYAAFNSALLDVTHDDSDRQRMNRETAQYCRDKLGIWCE